MSYGLGNFWWCGGDALARLLSYGVRKFYGEQGIVSLEATVSTRAGYEYTVQVDRPGLPPPGASVAGASHSSLRGGSAPRW